MRLSGQHTRRGALVLAGFVQCTASFVQFSPLDRETAVPSVERVNAPGRAHQQPCPEAQQHQDADDPQAGHSDRRDIPLRQLGSAPPPAGSERGPCAVLRVVVDMVVTLSSWKRIAVVNGDSSWSHETGIPTGSEPVVVHVQRARRRSPSMSSTVTVRRWVRR